MIDYWLLFISGFISSTLLPGGSEALFVYYLKQGEHTHWLYLLVVTAGNTLGSMLTYLMGYYFHYGQHKTAIKYPKTYSFCQRWGNASLLLSWLPIVGDVICLLAGWLRLPIYSAFFTILLAKLLRYACLMYFFYLAI